MLSLFKPPFWGRKLDNESRFPADDLACGIFRNYLVRKEICASDKKEDVQKLIESEFESLRQALGESSSNDHYNLIEATLRRVDERLKAL